jgi:hypothetical protein
MLRRLQTRKTALIVLLLCGCAGRQRAVHTTTHEKLVRSVEQTQGNSFPTQAYYCGSENDHDFFQVRAFVVSGSGVYNYRIKSAECPLTKRFPLTEDESRWLRYYPQYGRFTDELTAEWGVVPATNGLMPGPFWTNRLWKQFP